MRNIIVFALFLILNSGLHSQSVRSVVPDTGTQGASFPIVVHGTGTEWTLSPYFEVYFDSIGVQTNNAVIVDDSTITAVVVVDGKASIGFHKCVVADQYANYYTKDSAFWVFLNIPAIPLPLLPENNEINVLTTPYMLWDSNKYANTFRIQIATDSTFSSGSVIYDTVISNTPLTLRAGILNLSTKYYWRLNATNEKGTSGWSEVFRFLVRSVGISNLSSEIPGRFALLPNFPNPFNASTKIRFMLPRNGPVTLKIYDISGKEVESLVHRNLPPGTFEYTWNASSQASGIYFYVLESGNFREVRKAVLLK